MSYPFLILFSPAVIFLAYDLIFYFRPIYYDGCQSLCSGAIYIILMSDMVAAFGILMSILFINKLNHKQNSSRHNVRGVSGRWYLVALSVFVLLYFFLVYSVFDSFNILLVFSDYDRFYTMNSYGTAWVFLVFFTIIFFMLYDIYIASFNKLKLFVLLLSLVILAFTGGRSLVVILFAFLLFLIVVVRRMKVRIFYFIAILILAATVFGGNSLLRLGGSERYLENATSLDFNNAFILNDVVNYVDKSGPGYFVSLEDFYYYFVPRYFDEEKPVSTAETRLVYPEVAERNSNYTFGIYANILINLGYFGFLLLPVMILGLNFTYFYCALVAKRNPLSFALLFLSFYSIQFVRGGIINSRYLMFVISISVACGMWRVIASRAVNQHSK